MINTNKKSTFKSNVPTQNNITFILSQIDDKEQRYLMMKNIYMSNFYDCEVQELEMLDCMFRNESRLFYEN